MLVACPISDALITQIPADEEPLCGNAAVYAAIIIIIIIISRLDYEGLCGILLQNIILALKKYYLRRKHPPFCKCLNMIQEPVLGCFSSDLGELGLGGEWEGVDRTTGNCYSTKGHYT